MQSQAKILLIGVEHGMRGQAIEAFQSIGLQTIEADSAEIGMGLFNLHGADIVLFDSVMPDGMDGPTACAAFRKLPNAQFVPVLVMVGPDNNIVSINLAYEAGATDFIAKPINFTVLSCRVKHIIMSNQQTTKRLQESDRQLQRIANFDGLTELPNRQFFREHLQHMVNFARRQKFKLAILFMDLDGFKRINDTLGHHYGDLLLQAAGERLQKSLRASDIMVRTDINPADIALAHLGGDEFTALLSTIERNEDAAIVAERILANVSQPLPLDGHELYTTTSIGIAIFPDDGETGDELLKNADVAMYYAKRKGGNSYQYFSAQMAEVALRRHNLEANLRKAMERGELEMHYQPLLEIVTGQYSGMEALLRWHNLELGEILPEEFIPLAEETGLIVSVGEWSIRKACNQAATWVKQGIPLTRMAVNVSAMQVLHADFTHLISSILAETGLEPSLLELELTESALISDEDTVLGVLHTLKHIGVQLAIDDFGIGYSSLGRLKKFPIDRLKIDKSFVGDIGMDSGNGEIASAVIALAEGMGMKVTAEGVETDGQLSFLKMKRCHEVQGFFLCKPLNTKQVEDFLRQA